MGKKYPMKQYWWQDQVWEIPDSSSPLALEEHLDCQCVQRHKTCFHPQTEQQQEHVFVYYTYNEQEV